ncbi:UNVERIFIED_CONTAM: hypothetical protein Scaly_2824400 [Sesamum calycinum]|uniref:Uncharacterized protein n=1 Tax=Sesamum calycinum TaxID=2727403 RepID=A0AAW2ITW7_9LAMI
MEAMEDTPSSNSNERRNQGRKPIIMMLTALLANYEVGRIFIDSESSADIFFGEVYDQMQLGDIPLEKRNINIFAWTPQDLEGIDPNIIAYHLNINPNAKPVKQKKRYFGTKKDKIIQAEVDKLIAVEHIEEIQFPEWLSNVILAIGSVLIREKEGKQMLIYYVSKVLNGAESRQDKSTPEANVGKTRHLQSFGGMGRRINGVGVVITSPHGEDLEFVVKFSFKASNNEAEYEALLIHLKWLTKQEPGKQISRSTASLNLPIL